MRPKSIILLVLALGCGLVASIGISQVMDRRNQHHPAAAPEMQPIYVALKNVNVNDPFTEADLKLEEWPKGKVPVGALTKLDEVVGRRARSTVYAGEPILEAKLISADSPDSPSDTINDGFRVVPVRVDAASGGAGLVRPGDRVDVQLFVNKNPALGISETKAQTILQDVRVFAVDHIFRRGSDNDDSAIIAHTISLLVTPEQADRITLATKLGDLRLIMRNPDDKSEAHTGGVSIDDLFGNEKSGREEEEAGSKTEGSILDHLSKQDKEPVQTEPIPPAPANNWTMILLEGSNARELDFSLDGHLPQTTNTIKNATGSPPNTTGGSVPAADDSTTDGTSKLPLSQEKAIEAALGGK